LMSHKTARVAPYRGWYVRFGSKAEVETLHFDVRFTPGKRTSSDAKAMPAKGQ
jgi:hypothetical protein